MKLLLASIVITTALVMAASPAPAGDVTVAVDNYPPWKIVDGDRYRGIDIELVTALLKEIGLSPTFTPCPWARCLEMLKNGKADIITGVLRRPEREQYLHFIDPPYKTKSSKVFYLAKEVGDITTYEELRDLTIGVQRGAKYFDRFDNDASLRLDPVNNDTFNFRKLLAGRVDAVIATESLGDYTLSEMGLSGAFRKATYRHDREMPVHFAVSRNSDLIFRVRELTDATIRLKESGAFDRIINGYFKRLAEGSRHTPSSPETGESKDTQLPDDQTDDRAPDTRIRQVTR